MECFEVGMEHLAESRFTPRLSPSSRDPLSGRLSRAPDKEDTEGWLDEQVMRSWRSGWVPNHTLEPTATVHVVRAQFGYEFILVPVLACLSGGCGSA